MRIGVPLLGNDEVGRNTLAPGFHLCKYLGIYSLDSDKLEILEVAKNADGIGQNSILNLLTKENITAVISPSLKIVAFILFKDSSFAVFKAEGSDLESNIELLRNNKLSKYTMWQFGSDSMSTSSNEDF